MSRKTTKVAEIDTRSNLRLLSLDAGGSQAVSQLHILSHVMNRISHDTNSQPRGVAKRPCEVFDAIGGTGTGGLIAILLVVLKMTAKEVLAEFTKFVVEVYKDPDLNPEKQTDQLREVVYGILKRHGIDKRTKLIATNRPAPTCRLIVPVMYRNNVGATCVLRNHVVRQEPCPNLTVAEAMFATSAMAPMFTPISIGKDFATFEYISGDLGLSNPMREVISGAYHTFGAEATVACLLSIGYGHSGTTPLPNTSNSTTRIEFLEQLALDSEKVAQEIAVQMNQLTIYHRLSVNHGLDTPQTRAWRDPKTSAPLTAAYLGDLEVVTLVDHCVDAIKTGHGSATLERLRHSGGAKILPPPLPPLTPNYVERKAPMDFIERGLFIPNEDIKPGSKRIIVTGIGGCGKTQLARKFVEIYGDSFVSVFVVDGSCKDTLRRDIVRHVRSLDASHSQDSFEESMTFLSQPIPGGQRLLIIDNVDDPNLNLAPFLPRWTNGAVIVTSRNAERGQLSPTAHLQLDVMALEESVELLVRGSGREWPPSDSDREAAVVVAKELGCHPIALVQAIGYMSKTGYSADVYIIRLRRYREILLKDPATSQLDMRYFTAFAAFDASYDILPSNAQNMLHLLSFFHRLKFPLDLVMLAAEDDFSRDRWAYILHGEAFERGKEYLKETFCSYGQWSPLVLDQIVSSLRNQSLVTVVPAQDITLLEMHPLVHEWSRLRVPKEMLERVQSAATRLLCCGASKDNYLMMQYLVIHTLALSFGWGELHTNDAASFGFILEESGMYADAAKLKERVYGTLKNHHGVDHPNTTRASANLATTYNDLGRYNDALDLRLDALRQFKQLLGVDHPETIKASADLALTYYRLGRYNEALDLQLEALKQRKQLLGLDHPDTISASANLAATYYRLGRHNETLGLQLEVLEQQKQLMGLGHPDTIKASASLAITYYRLGRYNDALDLQLEALKQRNQLMGLDHPETSKASASLAITYDALGRYSDALGLKFEVLKRQKRRLGLDHPESIKATANLANTYYQLGRPNEALDLQLEVLERRKQLLGVDHPDTLRASGNLAGTYAALGRYAEAEELQIDTLRLRTSMFGDRHPHTLLAMANLALTYKRMQRGPEGIKLAQKAKKIALETLEDGDFVSLRISWALGYGEAVPFSI